MLNGTDSPLLCSHQFASPAPPVCVRGGATVTGGAACSVRWRCEREADLRKASGMGRMLTNPYKSVVPVIGDYDIGVVLEALQLKNSRISLHVVFNPKVRQLFKLTFVAPFNFQITVRPYRPI